MSPTLRAESHPIPAPAASAPFPAATGSERQPRHFIGLGALRGIAPAAAASLGGIEECRQAASMAEVIIEALTKRLATRGGGVIIPAIHINNG
ncbi:MAG: hypothetical protein MOB07_29665 [Acidobacteria bacterium]|nr:hypothetical protein [Acidobacteriota bacterium]